MRAHVFARGEIIPVASAILPAASPAKTQATRISARRGLLPFLPDRLLTDAQGGSTALAMRPPEAVHRHGQIGDVTIFEHSDIEPLL